MDKINKIFLGIVIMLFLSSCSNKKGEEMMEKTSRIEKGMTKNEVEKILQAKPKLMYKSTTEARGEFLICEYDLGHSFGYYFVVTYTNNKDSLAISSYWP